MPGVAAELEEALQAALKAAEAYAPVNRADKPHAELIVLMLNDCLVHAEQMDELASACAQADRVTAAQEALRAAEAGVGPDTPLTP